MLKQLFATMHDMLDEVMKQYPTADVEKKKELNQKLEVLKSMSDSFIEEWLKFEEKMAAFQETAPYGPPWPGMGGIDPSPQHAADTPASSEAFQKGQGYFQLLMYDHAIREFEKVIKQYPDFLLARLFLAMGHLRVGNDAEAYRHFHFITSLTEHAQMKAISYNAMGCIQAKNANMEQAERYFKLAYMADPSCVEPVINMGICLTHEGGVKPGNGFIH